MTWQEAYTSLLQLYKKLIFPEPIRNGYAMSIPNKWTMTEIDQLDVHFFHELMVTESLKPQEEEVYLSDVW